jgi:predicted acetyltransferase
LDNNGLFDIEFLDRFWEEEDLLPFLIKNREQIIGFILIQKGSFAPPTGEDYYVSEFFILRKYRRRGAGKKALEKLFTMFPGRYLLGQLPDNKAAIQFWKDVFKTFELNFEEFQNKELGSLLYQKFEVHL